MIEMKDIRSKERTVQAQIVEFIVLDMFSKGTIFGLVDILFRDMAEDRKTLIGPTESDGDDEDEEDDPDHSYHSSCQSYKVVEEEEFDDITKYCLNKDQI
jgi:hypothetical protein